MSETARASYEARRKSLWLRHGATPDGPLPRDDEWEELTDAERGDEVVGAQAAIDARIAASDDGTLAAAGRVADLIAERDRLIAERNEARAKFDGARQAGDAYRAGRDQLEERLGKIRTLAARWMEADQRPAGERIVLSASSAECGRQLLAILGPGEVSPETALRLPDAAIDAAAEAIDWEYYTNQGRHIERWARDIAIGALEAAWPFLPALGGTGNSA